MVVGGRCYACFRPLEACFCNWIPSIDNQTDVLILQHRREHFHRFNTARIVCKALRNSQLLADHTSNLAKRLRLTRRAGLLYPGPTAMLLSDLPVDQRPDQLVVIDGTWHQAKTIVRDIPVLQSLPRYQLAPSSPSRYRIRREPDAMSLSTVEAVVAALQMLEPATNGFEQLLNVFERMVEVQLAHPGSSSGARFKLRRRGNAKAIPFALQGDLANIVVAYGEASAGERGRKRVAAPPISWVAQRLGDGANFACTLTPSHPLSEEFLGHLELARADFATALSLAEARQRWAQFQRSGDLVTMIHPGTARLFSYLADENADHLLLNSADVKSILDPAVLADVSAARENCIAGSVNLGRATRRLAAAIALVRHLNSLAIN